MFKKPLLHPFVFILLIFLTPSCQAPKELVYRDFKNLSVDKIGFASTMLKIDLIYFNPNNFGLQLKYTDLQMGKEVMVKITGTVKLRKANVYKTFPVNYEGLQRFSTF